MFWDNNSDFKKLRVFDPKYGQEFNSNDINKIIDRLTGKLELADKSLITLIADNSFNSIAAYIAALRSGHAVMLMNSANDISLIKNTIDIYKPELIVHSSDYKESFEGYDDISAKDDIKVLTLKDIEYSEIFSESAVYLSTSGTTGSPKLVRLTYKNVQANAESIVEYLKIGSDESAVTSLPISYSYGLSVINTHILAGARIVCTNDSFAQKSFWTVFNEQKCTSFAGVPFNYYMLERLRFGNMNLPSLRTMTQAGGKLSAEKAAIFNEIARQKGYKFYVMYGQTEATARIAYVPFEKLSEKIGSAGIAIPGGKIMIMDDDNELPNGSTGEVVYSGPNVMLGYAETREMLKNGDEMKGLLRTGDIGYKDEDGYLFLTGRKKRFVKIVGQRINLDEVEKMLELKTGLLTATLMNDDELLVLIESSKEIDSENALKIISELYGLHNSLIKVKCVTSLIFNSSGKKDYEAMKELFKE